MSASSQLSQQRVTELNNLARKIRGEVLKMSFTAGTPHLASSLSPVDILVAAYFEALQIDPKKPSDSGRDRFIFSKGHAVPALYATLAMKGFFPESDLATFCKEGGHLPEQPSPKCAPGVELATGSLGHGLSVGLGMALAGRISGLPYRVYALLSDGECNEGSVWEAAMFAGGRKLDRVAVIVDFNKWQATDRSEEVMAIQPFRKKWETFGWTAHEVDGHDIGTLAPLLKNLPDGSGKPVAIIANTVKGKGVSFMEDDNNWHYQVPKKEHLDKGLKELGLT